VSLRANGMRMLLALTSLVLVSGWLPATQLKTTRVAVHARSGVYLQVPAPTDDFTEDLLDALAAEEKPFNSYQPPDVDLSQMDVDIPPRRDYVAAMDIEAAREKYRLHENDSGSAQVQVAVLSARIAYMTKHMQENKKDYSSLRGLTAMVTRRRKLLEYLLKTDRASFDKLTSELGIRTTQLLKPKLGGARGRR